MQRRRLTAWVCQAVKILIPELIISADLEVCFQVKGQEDYGSVREGAHVAA